MTRAAVLPAFGEPVAIEEISLREPGPGEVLVRVHASAVCITDTRAAAGHTLAEPPLIGGHAGAGVVEQVGPHAGALEPGDTVVIAGSTECGVCFFCTRGQPGACEELFQGMIPPRRVGRRGDGSALFAEGGVGTYAERMVYRESHVIAVETSLPFEQLCLLGCGVTSGLGAVLNIARVDSGSSVAVVGCGHLGLWMVQAARCAGAAQVIAVEPLSERRALAARLGATETVDPASGDPVEQVRGLANGGRGVDCALEAAGNLEAMRQAFLMTRAGGTFVPTGLPTENGYQEQLSLPVVDMALSCRRIEGSQTGGAHVRRDVPRFVRMMERGLVDAEPIVSRRFALEELGEAFAAARERTVITGVVTP